MAQHVCVKVKHLRTLGYPHLEAWLADPSNLYVGRRGRLWIYEKNGTKRLFLYPGSQWGNPFRVKKGEKVEDILEQYRAWMTEQAFDPQELEGKNLGCFCDPEDPCHAKVLAEWVNKKTKDGTESEKTEMGLGSSQPPSGFLPGEEDVLHESSPKDIPSGIPRDSFRYPEDIPPSERILFEKTEENPSERILFEKTEEIREGEKESLLGIASRKYEEEKEAKGIPFLTHFTRFRPMGKEGRRRPMTSSP